MWSRKARSVIRAADIDDPRLTLARPGLADAMLEGLIRSPAFRPTRPMQCAVGSVDLIGPTGGVEDQLLFGERFEVLEIENGLAFGRAARDGYVGRVRSEALAEAVLQPTHRVSAIRTVAHARPDYRAPTREALSLNALVTIEAEDGGWSRVARSGWLATRHLAPLDRFEDEPAAVAERFLGAPYRWGGRDALGVDCSGLVQLALQACGLACPRDADQQGREVGVEIDPAGARRGDLVFWPDHVAILTDATTALHANTTAMAVASEPLADLIARRGPPTVWRRATWAIFS